MMESRESARLWAFRAREQVLNCFEGDEELTAAFCAEMAEALMGLAGIEWRYVQSRKWRKRRVATG
jgi:hypothetical protein